MKRISLTYGANSAALFEPLLTLPHAVLLQSGDRRSRWGRYDILSADPARIVTYDEGTLRLGHERIPTGKPLELLRNAFRPSGEAWSGHFRSGFIGYFGYDLHHTLERLAPHPRQITGMPALWGGDYHWAVVTDHVEGTTILWYDDDVSTAYAQDLARRLGSPIPYAGARFAIESHYRSTLDDATYRDALLTIQRYIDAGDCYQVNLARHYTAGVSGDLTQAGWATYQRLIKAVPGPFSAYLSTPYGQVVCVSPERFLRFSGEAIETSPIKGTAPRHANEPDDLASAVELLRSAKDRAENLMIVDLLRNDLGRVSAVGSVTAPELFRVESFANVHHLVSTIRGVPAPGVVAWDALIAAFPGGSITGAPKIRAMEIINELEPVGRSVYCGSVGYVDRGGSMDTNIAIRTLVLSPTGVHCWGGGGIVADSVPALEMEEIRYKIGGLLQLTRGLGSDTSKSRRAW